MAEFVTWQEAEDALTEAFETLAALPDAEAGFLAAGSRSSWPQIVRSIRAGDYGDGQGLGDVVTPSPQLSRRMIDRAELVLLGPRAAALAVPEAHRALVGLVIRMQRWPGAEGFEWSRVWTVMGGRRSGVTSDAFRKRYSRAIAKVAVRMTAMGLG